MRMQLDRQIEEVVRAREDGARYWEIKSRFDVTMGRARELVRQYSPSFVPDRLAVFLAKQAHELHFKGKTYEEVAKLLKCSPATAFRAAANYEKALARRSK